LSWDSVDRSRSHTTACIFDGLQWQSTRGLGRYARQLSRHVERFGWSPIHGRLPEWRSSPGRVLLNEAVEPLWRAILKPDISIYPHNVLPYLLPGGRDVKVLVLHDLLFLEGGEAQSAGNRYRAKKLYHSLQASDVIISVSETSRQQIAGLVSPGKPMFVISNALAPGFEKAPERGIRPGGETCTVLHFGGTAASKNTRILLQAVGRLKMRGLRCRLLLAAMSRHGEVVERWKSEANLTDNDVEILPTLTDDELIAVYSRADVHCMPSQGEGFGIPVIEAARCGVPNVLSPLDVFHELLGDAAVFVEACGVEEIAEGIARAITEDGGDRTRLARTRTDRFLFDSVHAREVEPAFRAVDELVDSRGSAK
jgi:glycosyltransferase involved in cell wall biosynthesis